MSSENETLAAYYLERLRTVDQSWSDLCQNQRGEIERLQRRVNELQLQCALQRASVGEELGQFCVRFANAGSAPHGGGGNRLIPLRVILRFLNRATDGMVQDTTFSGEKRMLAPRQQQQQQFVDPTATSTTTEAASSSVLPLPLASSSTGTSAGAQAAAAAAAAAPQQLSDVTNSNNSNMNCFGRPRRFGIPREDSHRISRCAAAAAPFVQEHPESIALQSRSRHLPEFYLDEDDFFDDDDHDEQENGGGMGGGGDGGQSNYFGGDGGDDDGPPPPPPAALQQQNPQQQQQNFYSGGVVGNDGVVYDEQQQYQQQQQSHGCRTAARCEDDAAPPQMVSQPSS